MVVCAPQDLVRVDTSHRVLLTGTPLQNSLQELFYLMNFLEPDKFGDVEQFKAAYATLNDKDKVGGASVLPVKFDIQLRLLAWVRLMPNNCSWHWGFSCSGVSYFPAVCLRLQEGGHVMCVCSLLVCRPTASLVCYF
jgi:hypothetical protein